MTDMPLSRLVRKFWSADTIRCPWCNLMPVQYRAGLWKEGVGWMTGKLLGVHQSVVHKRLARGWNRVRAVTEKPKHQ